MSNIKYMNIKIVFLTISSLLFSFPVYAKELKIGDISLPANASSNEVISVIFQILVAMGALIAVVMVFMAGVEWMTSGGNPSKISSARNKIKNAVLGVGVLLGCSLILNSINEKITDIDIKDLVCEYGIIVKTEDANSKTIIKCIDNTIADIGYDIKSTIKWEFDNDSLLHVYAYSEPNFKGTRTSFNFLNSSDYQGSINGAKSIYIVRKFPGVYLYDDTGYKPLNKPGPLYVLSSILDLSSVEFNDKAKSVYLSSTADTNYFAVLFADPKYKGQCTSIASSSTNLTEAYTENIGYTVSSLVVHSSAVAPFEVKDQEVILYSSRNCGLDLTGNAEMKECRVSIVNTPIAVDMRSCRDPVTNKKWVEGDEVLSFEIKGDAALVLSTSYQGNGNKYTRCGYFAEKGTCVDIINHPENSYLHTIGGNKIKSFIILPNN